MNQIAIGRFIAEMRKAKGMTQSSLAEKLSISDKTVSKWECGNGFPEVSLIMPLCEKLQITANELLSAMRLSSADYQKKAEDNLMNLMKENAENKKKLIVSVVVGVISIVAFMALIALAAFLGIPTIARIALIAFAVVIAVVGIGAAIALDRVAGTFECPHCHEQFVPDTKAYLMGAHTFTKRKLTCPKCGRRGMCKHRITSNSK